MKRAFLILLPALILLSCNQPDKELLTVAEATGYESTSRYTDVMNFIARLENKSARLRTEIIATTTEGRDIPLMVLADPMPRSPEDLKNDSRIVVYVQANIHAGEVEGKEACMMFARDLLEEEDPPLFREAVVLICPILNADGNEKISTQNRTNQAGPVNGVGVRHNGRMLDLNRDAMKLETPEMQGVTGNVLNRWDPSVIMDMHTTNGVYRQEPVTFSWMMNPNGNRALTEYMRDRMMPAMSHALRETYHVDNTFYGEFINMGDPEQGYINYAAEPRYFVNYAGLRNRLAILNENYVGADFKTRVEGSYGLIRSLMDYATEHRQEIKDLLRAADEHTLQMGSAPQTADSFAIRYRPVPTPERLLVKTYETESYTDESGRNRYRRTDRKAEYRVPYLAEYQPVYQVRFPFAYLITVPDPHMLENLNAHGIEVETLAVPGRFEVEKFVLEELAPSPRLNQGHYTNLVKGHFETDSLDFEAGTLVVRTAQSLGLLAAYLLEPETDDGLLLWNYFDTYLVPQWGRGYFPYPVYRMTEKTGIVTVDRKDN